MRNKQSGFSIVELGLVVVVVVVLGAVGYLAYSNFLAPKPVQTANVTPPAASTAPTSDVKTAADLDSVTTQLDNVALDDSDSSTLNSAAGSF